MAEASFKPRISKTSEKMVNNRENIVERMVNRKAETDKKIGNSLPLLFSLSFFSCFSFSFLRLSILTYYLQIGQLRKLQEEVVLSTIKAIPTINQTSQKLQRPQGVMELWVSPSLSPSPLPSFSYFALFRSVRGIRSWMPCVQDKKNRRKRS